MATPIRFTPILKGEIAERFISMVNEKNSIDFSKEAANASKILQNAKL